jgi:hypothetical protein
MHDATRVVPFGAYHTYPGVSRRTSTRRRAANLLPIGAEEAVTTRRGAAKLRGAATLRRVAERAEPLLVRVEGRVEFDRIMA